MTMANTENVAQAVYRGDADLGFVEGEVNDPALAIRKMEGDSLALIVGPGHPWIGKARIAPKVFTETRWIMREPGSGTSSMFEAALKKWGAQTIRPRCPARVAVERSCTYGRGVRRPRGSNLGFGRRKVAGGRSTLSRQDRAADALVFRSKT